MSKHRILIVEDEKSIAKLISYNLEKNGYDTAVAFSGEKALKFLEDESFDLIILDIMLPKISGLEVCKKVKQNDALAHIPIIMLTAKSEEVDRILGFELGADDYVIKPFSPRELILRINAILKRGVKKSENEEDIIRIDLLKIDFPKHKVTVDKKKIALTLMEFNLLTTLIKRKGRVQSREQLLDDVWSIDSEITTRTIDTHIKRLRQKLGRKIGKKIETVRGIGYMFAEEE